MSSSSQQPQQQNIQAGSQAMDLAIVNENDTVSSSAQSRQCTDVLLLTHR